MAMYSDASGNYGSNDKNDPVIFPEGITLGKEVSVSVPSLPVTLSLSSNRVYVYNPAGAGDVNLDDSFAQGSRVVIHNRSENYLTIKSDNGDSIAIVVGGHIELVALQATPTTSAHWHISEISCQSGELTATGVTYTTGVGGGGSAPSGTVVHKYSWSRKNKDTWVNEHVTWTVAGTVVTSMRWDIHSDLPVPANGVVPNNQFGGGITLVGGSATAAASYVDMNGASSQSHIIVASVSVDTVAHTVFYHTA